VRYELGDDVWEIVQDGKQLVITTAGKASVRRFVSADHAAAQLGKLTAERLAAGYRALPDAPPAVPEPPPPEPPEALPPVEAREPTLEAAILADPYDAAAYAVYGDWLQKQGEPRGELIALMLALEGKLTEERKTAVRAQIRRLLLLHARALYGAMAAHVAYVHDYENQLYAWRYGFVHRIAARGLRPIADALHHPSGRFVAELVATDVDRALLDGIVALAPPSLRSLELSTKGTLELTALLAVLPQLRRISVWADDVVLERAASDLLERAELRPMRMSVECAHAIATARWPALQRLELRIRGGTGSVDALGALVKRTDLPRLTHLRVKDCPFAGELALGIAAGPLAAQLVVLDLTNGNVDDAVALRLARMRDRFPMLRELHLSLNELGTPGIAALRDLAKHVLCDRQRMPGSPLAGMEPPVDADPDADEVVPDGDDDDDDDRYDEIGE